MVRLSSVVLLWRPMLDESILYLGRGIKVNTDKESRDKASAYWDTLPEGIKQAMVRVKAYKQGRTATEVFGKHVEREGYHDDCQLIADFISITVIESIGYGVR
jgi:hypothetical protein